VFEEDDASRIFANETIDWDQEFLQEFETTHSTQNPDELTSFKAEGDEQAQTEFIPFDELLSYPQDTNDTTLYDASSDSESMYMSTQPEMIFVQPGSLLDLYSQSTQIFSPREEELSLSHKVRTKPLSTRKSEGHHPDISSSSECSNDEGDSWNAGFHPTHTKPQGCDKPPPKRRNDHTPGINKQTGKLTLVGQYPPMQLDLPRQYGCPHCWGRDGDQSSFRWTTRNGYKYHLANVCPGNPDSVKSIKLRRAKELGTAIDITPKKSAFSKVCECGVYFRSENGYKMHRMQNETTKNGRCMERGSRTRHGKAANKVEAQPKTFDVNMMSSHGWNEPMRLGMFRIIAPGLTENDWRMYQRGEMVDVPGVNQSAGTPDVNLGETL